jgi:formamidopyrimidine-DNA glycosylase
VQGGRAENLARAIKDVLNEAIAAGGSSLRDHRQPSGELGYFQHSFAVYGRTGQPCPDCDCDPARTGAIRRITQSGRSTFYCAAKQR